MNNIKGMQLIKALIIIQILILISCSNKTNNYNNIKLDTDISSFENFPIVKKITLKNLIEYTKGVPRDIFFIDSTLVINNLSKGIDAFFYDFSLKNKIWSDGYIKKGRGPNEAIGGFCGGITENYLWLYDITMKKVLTINKDLSVKKQFETTNTYPISKNFYKIAFIDSLNFYATGDNTSKYKIQKINLHTNKTIAEFGQYANLNESYPIDGIKDTYQAFIYVKPIENKVFLAYRFIDIIELYENHKHIITLQSPLKINLEVKLGANGFHHFFQKDEKTTKAFISGTTTDDYIYLAFSGQTRTTTWSYARSIFVYDWNGNPIKKLELNNYISALAVSPDNKTLYAYDANNGFIVEANIE